MTNRIFHSQSKVLLTAKVGFVIVTQEAHPLAGINTYEIIVFLHVYIVRPDTIFLSG